ncbi:hypothetical protein O7627_33055 [Solwaraspora sp. WMMD1047]|uniref:hypothetical protein n=1 Tax=Solwaraspora sp. WMMD1047 TaxID=3016102 RepID=UPI002415C58C|nr:hypothetical protein [Solwaraspora sp. WMMD1047]MDG4834094.1 hypothetical protein [Solwaraspora sp. WMMD1047]
MTATPSTSVRRVLAAAATVVLAAAVTAADTADPDLFYRGSHPLLRLADRIPPDPGPYGSVVFHHVRRWSVTTTGRPAERPDLTVAVAVDQRRWAAPDGSGRIISRHTTPDERLAAAHLSYRSSDAEFTTTTTTTTVEDLPAGALGGGCTVPWPCPGVSEPARPSLDEAYPARTVDEFTFLHLHFDLPSADRAAALRVLAATGGLTYQVGVVDRLGRPGLGVVLEVPPIRHRLILHPGSGHLLAAEQQLTGPHPHLTGVGPPAVVEYVLLVGQGRRGLVGQPDEPRPSGPGVRAICAPAPTTADTGAADLPPARPPRRASARGPGP